METILYLFRYQTFATNGQQNGQHNELNAYLGDFGIYLTIWKQESIPVGRVPQAWKLYLLQFQWPPPDVTRKGPKMNKLEQVSAITTSCH